MAKSSLSLTGAAAVVLSLAIAWNVVSFNFEQEAARRYALPEVVLPRPEVAKLASLGFRSVAADLFLMGAYQYFGDWRTEQACYPQLADYLDLAANLDPKFISVYRFGGASLPCHAKTGWVNSERAAALLERGIAEFPDDWTLRLDISFIESALLGRYADAGNHLKEAARIPGAPPYLGRLATRMLVSGGKLDAALAVAHEIVKSTNDPEIKRAMVQRARELATEQALEQINGALDRYRKRSGHAPRNLQELIRSGDLSTLPPEPFGQGWIYDEVTGTVRSPRQVGELGVYKAE